MSYLSLYFLEQDWFRGLYEVSWYVLVSCVCKISNAFYSVCLQESIQRLKRTFDQIYTPAVELKMSKATLTAVFIGRFFYFI